MPHKADELKQEESLYLQGRLVAAFDLYPQWIVATLTLILPNNQCAIMPIQRTSNRWGNCGPARYSPDFRSVKWYDLPSYHFTATQAACVHLLWDAFHQGTTDIGQDLLLERAGADSAKLSDVFRGSAAWGTLIVHGSTRGSFRLDSPISDTPKIPPSDAADTVN